MVTTILKGTRDCNLGCRYCYTEIRNTGEQVSLDTLRNFFVKIRDYELRLSDNKETSTNIIWHGGEPLLLGQEFYQAVVDMQKGLEKENFRYHNCMQSNGTLLTEEFYEFLHANNFGIGLSLDGPKHLNDMTRVYKDGSSTFNDVMRAASIISKKTRPGFISVVTSKTVDHLDEIVGFFKNRGYAMKINPLIPSGVALENEDLSVSAKDFGRNMSRLFRDWFANDGEDYARIDTFKDIIKAFIEAKPYGCNYNQTCQDTFISLSPNGDVYPCARFDGIGEFIIGNINSDNMDGIMAHPVKNMLKDRYKTLDKSCGSCSIGDLCNGGCMHNAYLGGDIMKKDPYCASHKMIFGTVKDTLTRYINKLGDTDGDKKTETEC